jgi:nucleotide-binding universal stress UspA family protein
MSFATIFLPVAGSSDPLPGLRMGLDLASRWSAHLDVVHVRPDPANAFLYTGLAPGGSDRRHFLAHQLEQDGKAAASHVRETFGTLCQGAGVVCSSSPAAADAASASWNENVGEASIVVPALATCADLTLFQGVQPPLDHLPGSLLEATLLYSGRPVLYLPALDSRPAFRRLVLAWDGAAASTRAVGAALPLCRTAESVGIVTISEYEDEGPDADRLARYLAWYGIAASISRETFDTRRLGEILLEAADRHRADLLVMGGYGHYRFRESLFGGVTRHVLRHTRLATFLVH